MRKFGWCKISQAAWRSLFHGMPRTCKASKSQNYKPPYPVNQFVSWNYKLEILIGLAPGLLLHFVPVLFHVLWSQSLKVSRKKNDWHSLGKNAIQLFPLFLWRSVVRLNYITTTSGCGGGLVVGGVGFWPRDPRFESFLRIYRFLNFAWW